MFWHNSSIREIARAGNFPLKISGIYYCNNRIFPFTGKENVCRFLEVSLRLRSTARRCEDRINGTPMNIPFPNVLYKTPGMKIALAGDLPRDTIAFYFQPADEKLLREWGLIPDEPFWPIQLNENLLHLIAEFRHLLGRFTLHGIMDQLDWVCLQIIREVCFQRVSDERQSDPESRIMEAALYFQHHFDRKISCDTVASRFGFSHAGFFREWRKHFDCSPQHYIQNFRLKVAAFRLLQTSLPISAIAAEVHFSSLTAFHRKFREMFGVSPDHFRHDPERWEREFPDFNITGKFSDNILR